VVAVNVLSAVAMLMNDGVDEVTVVVVPKMNVAQ
jgi:hypothetical protein